RLGPIARLGLGESRTRAGIDARGGLAVAWVSTSGAVMLATRPPGGRAFRVRALAARARHAAQPALAVGAAGRVAVAVRETYGDPQDELHRIAVTVATTSGRLLGTSRLGAAPGASRDAAYPAVAVNAGGDVAVAWEGVRECDDRGEPALYPAGVQVAHRARGSVSFAVPSVPATDAGLPSLA